MENITGSEPRSDDPRINALIEFYAGFNQRNLEAVSGSWAPDASIVMSNPLGGLKRGGEEVHSVYRRLFTGQASVHVEFHDFQIMDLGEGFVAVGRERGFCQRGESRIALEIRTSRAFRKVEGSWKQIHHHGSIDDPELLKAYQLAIFGTTKEPDGSVSG